MFTTDSPAQVAVGDQLLRIAVRPGQPMRSGTGHAPRTAGPTAGVVPLLLINGVGASLELLAPFIDELDPGIEVVSFDVPGVGGSPLPDLPYRFSGLCRLIARMLTTLGYDSADVLGISWGGGVAQHFAAFHRSRCRRLVLASTGTGALMVPGNPAVLARLMTRKRYTEPGYLDRIAPDLYGGSARADPAGIAAALKAHNRVGPARGYAYQVAAGAGWTSLPFLPLLRQPTLIIAGDDDPIIPLVNGRLMHLLIPQSRLHVFHGGHLGLVTEAAQLAPVVSEFLAAP
jgi:poly(3-hydroxyalkanoate) depolymerase